MVLTARRAQAAAGSTRVLREGLPRLPRVLEEIDDRRVVQVRMIPVSAHPERATANECDVVRLGRVRDAGPTRGERELVRELRQEGRGAIDLVQVLVLHEDDDELVEVVRRLREHGTWDGRAIGNAEGK